MGPSGLAQLLRQDLYELGAISRSVAEQNLRDRAIMHGSTPADAALLASRTVSHLILCGDISAGTAFGEQMLLKRARSTVVLDAGRVLLLGGDPDEGDVHGLLRICDESEPMAPNLAELLVPLSHDGVVALRRILDERAWMIGDDTPQDLLRALLFLGLEDETDIDDEIAQSLLDLFPSAEARTSEGLDSGQEEVVVLPAGSRTIVTAGPGSGKTHTASARIVRLVEQGVPPAEIELITFTRVAAEIAGRRINKKIREVSYGSGVSCGTLDSFAWHLVAATSETEAGSQYNTIRQATRLLKKSDQRLRDRLSRIRHLVIDEAQDIVGPRLEFCVALIVALPDVTGVTVLGDWAQAIYGGWAGVAAGTVPSLANLHVRLEDTPGWKRKQLRINHRTQSPRLRQMFTSAREMLSDGQKTPKDRYLGVRALIEDAATNPSVDLVGQAFPWRDGNLVLFRSAASAEAGSARLIAAGRAHRLKLSGRTLVANPIAGVICAGMTSGMSVSLEQIKARFAQLSPQPFNAGPDEAHGILRQLAGSGRANPSITKIAEGLLHAPLALMRDHIGTAGPMLGSIHGAKGQEANDVLLMLPPVPADDDTNWDEEARVLFVAATRATKHLHLGHARVVSAVERLDGTRWLRGQGLAFFGTEGLTASEGLVPATAVWAATFSHPLCSFSRAPDGASWRLVLESGLALADADTGLTNALDYLAAGRDELPFGKLRIVGATSVPVLRADGQVRAITILPVLQGVLQGNRAVETGT